MSEPARVSAGISSGAAVPTTSEEAEAVAWLADHLGWAVEVGPTSNDLKVDLSDLRRLTRLIDLWKASFKEVVTSASYHRLLEAAITSAAEAAGWVDDKSTVKAPLGYVCRAHGPPRAVFKVNGKAYCSECGVTAMVELVPLGTLVAEGQT